MKNTSNLKVLTLTSHRVYNYGAVLQSYALMKYLLSQGCEAKVIDYNPKPKAHKNVAKRIGRYLIRKPDFIKSEKVFSRFINKYMKLTNEKYYKIEDLKQHPPNADIYIVGSDQVWNCKMANGNDDSFFLTFVPPKKLKASYAASIAMESLDDTQKKRFERLLKDFTDISVREYSSVKLLNEAGVTNVTDVLDPVFLLSDEEWVEYLNCNEKSEEPYVLVYGFYGQKEVYQYASELARIHNCKVYSVNTKWTDFMLGTDKYFWNISPTKFLSLIINAEHVVTNSFHGLSFSIIFNKEVHVFNAHASGNVRMNDLLYKLQLTDRLVSCEYKNTINARINYERVNLRVTELVNFSRSFIDNILEKGERLYE